MKRPDNLVRFPKPKISDLEKIAIKVITKKDFDKNSLSYYREQFIHGITRTFNIDRNEKITLKKLVETFDLSLLKDSYISNLEYRLLSTVDYNTPNKAFIKEYIGQLENFVDTYYTELENGNYDTRHTIETAFDFQHRLNSYNEYNIFHFTYQGCSRNKLNQFMKNTEINDKLNDKEKAYLIKIITMLYDKFISRYFDINDLISYRLSQHGINERVIKFVKSNPEIRDFILNNWYEIEDKGYWSSFKIDKKEHINTTYSSVVSSSFWTYYNYDLHISFMNQKFEFNNIVLDADYYSGGWN